MLFFFRRDGRNIPLTLGVADGPALRYIMHLVLPYTACVLVASSCGRYLGYTVGSLQKRARPIVQNHPNISSFEIYSIILVYYSSCSVGSSLYYLCRSQFVLLIVATSVECTTLFPMLLWPVRDTMYILFSISKFRNTTNWRITRRPSWSLGPRESHTSFFFIY